MTDEQKAAKYAYQHELYRWKREHGICYICGCSDAILAGLCGACYARKAERDRERRQKDKAKYNAMNKARREANITAGICVDCGQRLAEPGKRDCWKCLAKRRMRKRIKDAEKRVSRPPDQCRWCDEKVVPGYHYCSEHLERMRESAARMRECVDLKSHVWRADEKARFMSGGIMI